MRVSQVGLLFPWWELRSWNMFWTSVGLGSLSSIAKLPDIRSKRCRRISSETPGPMTRPALTFPTSVSCWFLPLLSGAPCVASSRLSLIQKGAQNNCIHPRWISASGNPELGCWTFWTNSGSVSSSNELDLSLNVQQSFLLPTHWNPSYWSSWRFWRSHPMLSSQNSSSVSWQGLPKTSSSLWFEKSFSPYYMISCLRTSLNFMKSSCLVLLGII